MWNLFYKQCQNISKLVKNFTLVKVSKSPTKTIVLGKQNVIFAADLLMFTERNSLECFEKFEPCANPKKKEEIG